MNLVGKLIHSFVESRARGSSLDEISQELERSGTTLSDRLASAVDTPPNRGQAIHVIGIERWGQNRLKAALGNPLVMDEYAGYCPGDLVSLQDLSGIFTQTRNDTLTLAGQLKQANAGDKKVSHNQLGNLSVKAWLVYLSAHANRELSRMKKK